MHQVRFATFVFATLFQTAISFADHADFRLRPAAPVGSGRVDRLALTLDIPHGLAVRLLAHPADEEDEIIPVGPNEVKITTFTQEKAVLEYLAHFDETHWKTVITDLEAFKKKVQEEKGAQNDHIVRVLTVVAERAKELEPACLYERATSRLSEEILLKYGRMQHYKSALNENKDYKYERDRRAP